MSVDSENHLYNIAVALSMPDASCDDETPLHAIVLALESIDANLERLVAAVERLVNKETP